MRLSFLRFVGLAFGQFVSWSTSIRRVLWCCCMIAWQTGFEEPRGRPSPSSDAWASLSTRFHKARSCGITMGRNFGVTSKTFFLLSFSKNHFFGKNFFYKFFFGKESGSRRRFCDDGKKKFKQTFLAKKLFKLLAWRNSMKRSKLCQSTYLGTGVTRLSDLLDFGQLFKAFDNN